MNKTPQISFLVLFFMITIPKVGYGNTLEGLNQCSHTMSPQLVILQNPISRESFDHAYELIQDEKLIELQNLFNTGAVSPHSYHVGDPHKTPLFWYAVSHLASLEFMRDSGADPTLRILTWEQELGMNAMERYKNSKNFQKVFDRQISIYLNQTGN